MVQCHCEPEFKGGYPYIQWIGDDFADCVYTPSDQASFYLGIISTGIWAVAQLPQLYETYKHKSAEAISPWFLIQWLAADLMALAAAIWTDQLPIEVWQTTYFVCLDMIILTQWYYYAKVRDRIFPPTPEEVEMRKNAPPSYFGYPRTSVYALLAGVLVLTRVAFSWSVFQSGPSALPSNSAGSRVLLDVPEGASPECNFQPELTETEYAMGHICAWAANILITTSRLPQVYRNYVRKDFFGLSKLMIALAVAANLTYFASIFTRIPALDEHFYRDYLPFLAGAGGTLLLDAVILIQGFIYRDGAYAYNKVDDGHRPHQP